MSKRVALKDSVIVDSVDLSNLCRDARYSSEHSEEDVSGFNATGADEMMPGRTTQSLTFEFFGAYGTGEVHATLWPMHRDREIVMVQWRPDQTLPASATNPEARGNAQLYTYGPGATRGDVDTFTATFRAADEDGISFFDTPLGP